MTDTPTFPYVIVTSIELKEGQDGKVIIDSEAVNGTTAVFVEDLKEIGQASKQKKIFEGKQIKATEARDRILQKIEGTNKIPLFCVHGFSNEPISTLKKAVERHEALDASKYYPVFVIWPCSGFFNREKGTISGYNPDADKYAPNAGNTFSDFVRHIPDSTFPRKSLMMHSMGNHVVFDGACLQGAPEVQFENIFFVAADVPHDIFMKNPKDDYSDEDDKRIWGNKNKKANNFYQMLAKGDDNNPKGKIVVLHNSTDKALWWSSWVENGERRLGQRGMAKKSGFLCLGFKDDHENVLDIFKDVYVNEDMESEVGGWGVCHGYNYSPAAINIFNKYALLCT